MSLKRERRTWILKNENELPDTVGEYPGRGRGVTGSEAEVQGSLAWVGSIVGPRARRGSPVPARVCPGARGPLPIWTRGLESPGTTAQGALVEAPDGGPRCHHQQPTSLPTIPARPRCGLWLCPGVRPRQKCLVWSDERIFVTCFLGVCWGLRKSMGFLPTTLVEVAKCPMGV